jgi:hypothetical protein
MTENQVTRTVTHRLFCGKRPLNPGHSGNFQPDLYRSISCRRSDPWQRPCRFPKRKSGSRICAPLRERFAQRDAYLDRHRRQSFLVSLVIYDEWSWSALKQFWCRFRILIYGPMICQWLIHIKEIGPASFESSYHISARDIMTALPDAVRDPT